MHEIHFVKSTGCSKLARRCAAFRGVNYETFCRKLLHCSGNRYGHEAKHLPAVTWGKNFVNGVCFDDASLVEEFYLEFILLLRCKVSVLRIHMRF